MFCCTCHEAAIRPESRPNLLPQRRQVLAKAPHRLYNTVNFGAQAGQLCNLPRPLHVLHTVEPHIITFNDDRQIDI